MHSRNRYAGKLDFRALAAYDARTAPFVDVRSGRYMFEAPGAQAALTTALLARDFHCQCAVVGFLSTSLTRNRQGDAPAGPPGAAAA